MQKNVRVKSKEDDLVLVGVDDVRKGLTLKKALSIIKLKIQLHRLWQML